MVSITAIVRAGPWSGVKGSYAARMEIRAARPNEAGLLSDLALRSKAHWGYDATFLEHCRPVLTLTPADLVEQRATVAEVGGRVVGFCTLAGEPPEGELSYLFVDPDHIG